MLEVVVDYKSGDVQLVDVPVPLVRPKGLLVQNSCSAASVGTEALMLDMAKKSLLGKARARPDLVKQVIAKARDEGILEAYRAAKGRLETPVPLGYSCAGRVTAVGQEVRGYEVGDAVACFGSGYASHAEVVSVPENLCVPIPEGVDFEAASFVGPGAIALHAIHMGEVSLGSRIVVLGLGLLGQLAVQMVAAAGGRVFGLDLDPRKNDLAVELGADAAETPGPLAVDRIKAWSGGVGADGVLVFASSKARSPVELAAESARERAWVVVPGMVDLDLPRRLFYEKELRLVVSRSAGPGIYDRDYEEKGVDYPVAHVRWTAQRNMSEFLELAARGKVRMEPMITHRVDMARALDAYGKGEEGDDLRVGVIFTYPDNNRPIDRGRHVVEVNSKKANLAQEAPRLGMVGAGMFARVTLLPAIKSIKNIELRGVATASGLTAQHSAKKFGFGYATSDYQELLSDPSVNCVIIATRHDLHAPMACTALKAGKDVFVEKPLATTCEGLLQVMEAYRESPGKLMVGFNRRYSPFSSQARLALEERSGPVVLNLRINAGSVPHDSWVLDPLEGGGRVIGELCHFVDLVQFISGATPEKVFARRAGPSGTEPQDIVVSLDLDDGSVASIVYVSIGDRAYPREQVEVFWEDGVCSIRNFKSMEMYRRGKRSRTRKWNVDRGHTQELETFFDMVRGRPEPVPFESYVATTLTTFAIERSLASGKPEPTGLSFLTTDESS